MSFPFHSSEEFTRARTHGEPLFTERFVLPDELDFRKLNAVLTKTPLGRLIAVKKWLKEVGRLCGVKIKLKLSLSPQRPYMRESGEIGLYYKELFRPRYLFFAIAHETAHFLLMRDEDYPALKAIDREYPSDAQDRAMQSPIEYMANAVMLAIFGRCAAVARKKGAQEAIAWCIACFREQEI